jgi:hypothetical protein
MIMAAEGILAVKDGAFEAALEQHIGARDVKPPELAGLRLINGNGRPVWPGFALGKEYAGHTTERQTSSLSPTVQTGQIGNTCSGTSVTLVADLEGGRRCHGELCL